ncbi:MAG TPA: hypothetical protein RMH99_26120 [Sandaracinaceae bacterium LLY-WYZ-13_1]|nr:hypothetical protein [Sandaracinaceae bacterium LLY-WYZ-13_1]
MSDNTHTRVYQRFFAILTSVIPGLNLVLGLAALVLWLFADIVMIEWGWAIGIAAIVLCITFIGWVFVGLGVQKWAEDKPAGLLFGINLPFLLADFGFMGWLFVRVVIGVGGHGEEAESAALVVQALSALV